MENLLFLQVVSQEKAGAPSDMWSVGVSIINQQYWKLFKPTVVPGFHVASDQLSQFKLAQLKLFQHKLFQLKTLQF